MPLAMETEIAQLRNCALPLMWGNLEEESSKNANMTVWHVLDKTIFKVMGVQNKIVNVGSEKTEISI